MENRLLQGQQSSAQGRTAQTQAQPQPSSSSGHYRTHDSATSVLEYIAADRTFFCYFSSTREWCSPACRGMKRESCVNHELSRNCKQHPKVSANDVHCPHHRDGKNGGSAASQETCPSLEMTMPSRIGLTVMFGAHGFRVEQPAPARPPVRGSPPSPPRVLLLPVRSRIHEVQ